MSTESVQRRISDFWSRVAPDYEAHEGNVVAEGSPDYAAWVAEVRALLPREPSDVLDVGCGTGFMARAVASLGHRVTGIDLAPAMLEVAQREAASRGLSIEYRPGDATAPPFEPASWDVITSRHLLWTLREPDVAFANWRRLLRAGGRVVAIDGFWFTHDDDAEATNEEREPGPLEQHYDAATRAALPFMSATDMGPVVQVLRAAGFGRVDVQRLSVATVAGNPPWAVVAYP